MPGTLGPGCKKSQLKRFKAIAALTHPPSHHEAQAAKGDGEDGEGRVGLDENVVSGVADLSFRAPPQNQPDQPHAE